MRHLKFAAMLGALALGLPGLAFAHDLSGSWSVSGKDRNGNYRGTATLRQDPGGNVTGTLALEYVRWDWPSTSYKPTGVTTGASLTGRLVGQTFTGKRTQTAGLSGVLVGGSALEFNVTYGLSLSNTANAKGSKLRSFGGRYDGSRGRDSLADHDPTGSVTPPPPPPTGDNKITVGAKLLAVPGTPAAGRQPVEVVVAGTGDAQLTVTGPGRLLRDGAALTGAVTLAPGTHKLQVEGTADGKVSFALARAGATLASASSDSTVERLYLILMGYQGAEEDYLEGDIMKTITNIVPSLPGYTRIEDGSAFDQAKIDRALEDPATPRRVVIDWSTTREEMFRYFARGTIRGVTWGSHGFMEPFPGCTDAELSTFESRIWSCPPGQPALTEKKNFTREWVTALAVSARTHGKLDFALMHSCCTGGIGAAGGPGSYRDEVWHYTAADTKSRAMTVLGDPLPTYDRLTYKSFNELAPHVTYLKTYDGASYFGLHDVSWSAIKGSLRPTR
jgi:hypothetical protein